MTIGLRRVTNVERITAAEITVTPSTPPVENDIIFVLLTRIGVETWTLAAGFTLLGTPAYAYEYTNTFAQVAWKRAGASEPASYTFSRAVSAGIAATMVEIYGAIETGDPVAYTKTTDPTPTDGHLYAGSVYYVPATLVNSAELTFFTGIILTGIDLTQNRVDVANWNIEYNTPYIAGQGFERLRAILIYNNVTDFGTPAVAEVTITGDWTQYATGIHLNILPESENQVSAGTLKSHLNTSTVSM